MNFDPKTEEEIQKENLLPKGDYSFEVLEAKDKVAKSSGAEMIELKLEVFSTEDESSRILFDYLMAKMAYKLRHFCSVTGLIQKYNAGTLKAENCVGKTGLCKIIIQEDRTGNFPPKNSVQDYISETDEVQEKPVRKEKPASQPDMAEDDIQF